MEELQGGEEVAPFEVVAAEQRFLVHQALFNLHEALRVRGYTLSIPPTAEPLQKEKKVEEVDFLLTKRAVFSGVLEASAPPTAPAIICGRHIGDVIHVILFLKAACNKDAIKEVVRLAMSQGAHRLVLITRQAVNIHVAHFLERGMGGIPGERFTVEELAPPIMHHCLAPKHKALPLGDAEGEKHRKAASDISTDDPQIKLLGLSPGIIVKTTACGIGAGRSVHYHVTALPDNIRFRAALAKRKK